MTDKITIAGSMTLNPPSACSSQLATSFPFNVVKTCERSFCRGEQIAVVSPTYQDLLAGSNITAVQVLALQVSGSVLLRVSSTDGGADQVIPVSGLFLWSADQTGQELTAVAVQGTATIQLIVAGR